MTKTGVNNLSQQLCELCGIEPKILYKSKSNLSSGTCWKTREEYKNSACNQSWSETENTRYPDFEKPENFVKLFNLNHVQDTTICSMMTCRHKQIKNSNEFIKELVIFLQFYSGLEYTDRIKQAIASEEWEY